jgi:hypothetical protein
MRVVRTEAGRCWSEGAEKSHEAAIEAGLDVKKRWSAALDSRTRLSHARLDGTYADKDGLFWISGSSAPQPRQFGVAAEDINCRCAVYDVLEGLEPSMRRIRDLEGDDGHSSEKAKSRIVPYQSFETWAKPQGWTADKGWPKVQSTPEQIAAAKATRATKVANPEKKITMKDVKAGNIGSGLRKNDSIDKDSPGGFKIPKPRAAPENNEKFGSVEYWEKQAKINPPAFGSEEYWRRRVQAGQKHH